MSLRTTFPNLCALIYTKFSLKHRVLHQWRYLGSDFFLPVLNLSPMSEAPTSWLLDEIYPYMSRYYSGG